MEAGARESSTTRVSSARVAGGSRSIPVPSGAGGSRATAAAASRASRDNRALGGSASSAAPGSAGVVAGGAAAGAGRFSSARKAVRFAGLDITVHSSDGKRGPGRLSRQGPAVLRWCLYEAGKTHARGSAPDDAYYARVKDRIDGKRGALSEGRKIVRRPCHMLGELGDDALTRV